MYEKSISALKKSNRFRQRDLVDPSLIDFASNDYLGFAQNKQLLDLAYQRLLSYPTHAPTSSLLVNGYHPIHKNFEDYMSTLGGFEDTIVVGSGYLANMALLESLPRKGDLLLIDEDYHASGVSASKLNDAEVVFFRHNDMDHLKDLLNTKKYKKAIIAVEGVYSMRGDLLKKDVFDIVDSFNALLIVDEAHSIGVLGSKMLGVFDLFDISPKSNHIKMGTLGKAIGSYGAYICASKEVISFLENRAKSIIYTTAPSLFDIALAHESFLYLQSKLSKFIDRREDVFKLAKSVLDINMSSLILVKECKSSAEVLHRQNDLKKKGFILGAIRPPTVKTPLLRLIPRLNINIDIINKLFLEVQSR